MYSEATFNMSVQDRWVGSPALGVSLGTVTASATQTYTGTAGTNANGVFRFPVFKNPVKIENIRVYCTGAAGAGVTAIGLVFLNGTSTIGSATAPAVSTFTDVTLTALTTDSHGVATGPTYFSSTNGEILMLNTAIGTASASALGSYAIDVTWRNLFTT